MSKGINFTFFFFAESTLQLEGFFYTRGMAALGLRLLCNIFYCCFLQEFGLCFSFSVAGHFFRPARDCCLGELLLYLLANFIWAHLMARGLKVFFFGFATLCGISYCFQQLFFFIRQFFRHYLLVCYLLAKQQAAFCYCLTCMCQACCQRLI